MKLAPALLGILFTTSALAEGAVAILPPESGDRLEFNLGATVSGICGVYSVSNPSTTTSFDVDFGDLGLVPSTSSIEARTSGLATSIPLNYACNLPGGFSRTVSSENGGFMFRDGTTGGEGDRIAYEMTHSGASGLAFGYQQLTAAIVTNHVDVAFLDGEIGSVRFRANGVLVSSGDDEDTAPSTSAYAGDYADKVTIAVTAN